ncbi:MAG: hypothetical protein H0V41_00145 [Pseudonocardiales bacterium]|nr:hypothetical protein [Pseudonocardiales bacterium]
MDAQPLWSAAPGWLNTASYGLPPAPAWDALQSVLADWRGWFSGQDVHTSYYGLPLRLARSARRFDTSPAWFSWIGTAPALELVEQIGIEAIRAHNLALANRFRAGLGLADGDSAIVSAAIPDADRKLAATGIRAATRAGDLRVSFHIYSTEIDVDTALNALTS